MGKKRIVDDTSREACWRRFIDAVEDARAGHYAKGHALIERVRAKGGNFAAACMRAELRAFVDQDRIKRERANARLSPVQETPSDADLAASVSAFEEAA
jgi:hypothetical protein